MAERRWPSCGADARFSGFESPQAIYVPLVDISDYDEDDEDDDFYHDSFGSWPGPTPPRELGSSRLGWGQRPLLPGPDVGREADVASPDRPDLAEQTGAGHLLVAPRPISAPEARNSAPLSTGFLRS